MDENAQKIDIADDLAVWEYVEDEMKSWYRCSKCRVHNPKTQWLSQWFSPYCPNCGRKMLEESEKADAQI